MNNKKSQTDNRKKPVVNSAVKIKKKGIKDEFTKQDSETIKNHVMRDIILPSIKNILFDSVMSALKMTLFGTDDIGTRNSSSNARPSCNVQYGSFYRSNDRMPKQTNVNIGMGFDYDKLIFQTSRDATIVLNNMDEMIDNGYTVTVGDLYDLSNVTVKNPYVNNYGWTDLRTASVIQVRDGWVIKLPRPIAL